jgi:hypothetical protein
LHAEAEFLVKYQEYRLIISQLPLASADSLDSNTNANIVAEGVFIRYFTLWERTIEKAFIYFCQGGVSLSANDSVDKKRLSNPSPHAPPLKIWGNIEHVILPPFEEVGDAVDPRVETFHVLLSRTRQIAISGKGSVAKSKGTTGALSLCRETTGSCQGRRSPHPSLFLAKGGKAALVHVSAPLLIMPNLAY